MRLRRRTSVLGTILLLASSLPALAATVAVKTPTAAELQRVRAHEAGVVLIQVKASIDGKRVSPTREYDTNKFLRFYVANLDDLDAPKLVFPASLSEAAANEGWRYLVLAPGVYYLLILPPGVEQNPPAVAYSAASGRYGRLTQYEFKPGRGGFFSPELGAFVFGNSPPPDFRELQGFWFQVPADGQIVYLGSLSVACKSGRGLFGSLLDSCGDFEFADDPRAAQELAAASLSGLNVEALGLVPYGRARPGLHVPELDKVAVTARTPSGLAAAFTGAELAPWGTIHGTGTAIELYNLLAIGGKLLGQSSSERRAKERAAEIQPCIDRLSTAIAGRNLPGDLSAALASVPRSPAATPDQVAALPSQGPGPSNVGDYRLTTSLPILRLRESGQGQQLALELGLDVRLEAAGTGRLGYHSLLLYGPESPLQNPHTPRSPLYARVMAERATPRPLSEWCDAGGAALLQDEVSAALKQIAAQAAQDLH